MLENLNYTILIAFISTFLFVSITPGICMTFAMTLGMTIGFRKTLWMMIGELFGIGLIALFTALGVATLMLNYPQLFNFLKYGGGIYLLYLGINLCFSNGRMAIKNNEKEQKILKRTELIIQGFITAICNPKGWAFFVSLLPPFIKTNSSLLEQLSLFVVIILVLEFLCLCVYCFGGRILKHFLQKTSNVKIINCISGVCISGVSLWLIFF